MNFPEQIRIIKKSKIKERFTTTIIKGKLELSGIESAVLIIEDQQNKRLKVIIELE